MIDVALLSVIRRWHLREGQSIRQIARRTGLLRNTVRKYLHSRVVKPKYPLRKSASKLDAFAEILARDLAIEASKGRRQRRNLRRLYTDPVTLGYVGSYDRVAAFARNWRRERLEREQRAARGAYVPLRFALCEVFGGVPKRGIYDNMKTAVDKVGRGKVREVNARFRAMASHFLFEPEFCKPAAGWEKAQIEKNVQDALWRNNTCRSDCGARHLRHTHERIRQGHTRPPGRPRARPDGLARPMLSDAP